MPNSSNWISVGELGRSFAPDSNILTPSKDLAGRAVHLHLADGRQVSYVFRDEHQVEAPRLRDSNGGRESATYLATSLRPGIYFVDFLRGGLPAATSLVLDLGLGVATTVTGILPPAEVAYGSLLKRAQRKAELSAVEVEILPATLDRPFDPGLPHHAETADLIGLRLQHRYNPHEVYEHIYLNQNRYAWHCLSGIEAGLADVDRCHYYRIADKLYLFLWREKIVPTLGAVMIDLEQMKTTGKIFGYADDSLTTLTNFPVGAHSKIVNKTEHSL